MSRPFPARIGDLLPERLIGRGAMAAVYLCRHPSGHAVAVKWMDDDHPPLVRRFERECAALARLKHPSIVAHLGHGVWAGRPYLVMEYIEGSDLRLHARKLGKRPPTERVARARTLGQALCEALSYIHAQGLVHRDIKPSNVMVAEDGRVILTDFGVVKDMAEADRTTTGLMVGTLAYAAPEQIDGGDVDVRTDLFGLGATLYFMLTLKRPFEGPARGGSAQPPPPSTIDPSIPGDLDRAVMGLLSEEPARRPRDASAASRALSGGSGEGVRVAGRQHALRLAGQALDGAAEGRPVLIRLTGTMGAGRGWFATLLQRTGERRGVRVLVVQDSPDDALAALAAGGAVAVVTSAPMASPAGVEVVDVPLPPLGVADVRRTLVATAPLTSTPAAVAARLHRLSGGTPGLLVPLIQRYSEGQAVDLPDVPEINDVLAGYIGDLDVDEADVLGLLAVEDGPVRPDVIEQALQVPAPEALARLARRGVVRELEGRWVLGAELFRAPGCDRVADVEGLRARVARARAALGGGVGLQADVPRLIAEARALLLRGDLAAGQAAAVRAAAVAKEVGEPGQACDALCLLGQSMLDASEPAQARGPLADATAIARAADLRGVRRLSHALRATADLDERPRDRPAAAGAIDRLMPIAAGATSRPPDYADALVFATWARAGASLGDRRTFRRARDRALDRLDGLDDHEQSRVLLALAEGAWCLRDGEGARGLLERVPVGAAPTQAVRRRRLAAQLPA